MTRINRYYALVPLEPLGGIGDLDDIPERYLRLNRNSETEVKQLIQDELTPYLARIDSANLDKIKLALRYCLTRPESLDWERVFAGLMIPFEPPDDPKRFGIWLWEVCFPNEHYQLENPDAYVIHDDINEPTYRIRLTKK